MTYPLLAYCNRRNAAELARGDLDARPLMSEGWAPPTGDVVRGWHLERYPRPFPAGTMLAGNRRLGRGDRIHCGEQILQDEVAATIARGDREALRGFYRYCNVCRPFDEAHAAREARNWSAEPFTEYGALRAYDGTNNVGVEWATPPNHGHGAACGCKKHWEPMIGPRRRYLASRVDCPWCAGTGRLICDDERAGRVSPSHAAGGYAEWQRKNSAQTLDWGAGLAPELLRIWETRRRVLDGVLTTIAAHSPDFPRVAADESAPVLTPGQRATLDERARTRTPHVVSSTRGFDWLGSEHPDDDKTE